MNVTQSYNKRPFLMPSKSTALSTTEMIEAASKYTRIKQGVLQTALPEEKEIRDTFFDIWKKRRNKNLSLIAAVIGFMNIYGGSPIMLSTKEKIESAMEESNHPSLNETEKEALDKQLMTEFSPRLFYLFGSLFLATGSLIAFRKFSSDFERAKADIRDKAIVHLTSRVQELEKPTIQP